MTRWIVALMMGPFLCLAQGGSTNSTGATAPGETSPGEKLALEGVKEFSGAYDAWDARRFGVAAEWFDRASAQDPRDACFLYWSGASRFHQALRLAGPDGAATNSAGGDEAMEAAVDALNRALKADQRNAETHAMLATLYGLRIKGNFFRGARYGPKVDKHREQALKWGPENPRVQYLLGTALFYTASGPKELRRALTNLLSAEKAFAAESALPVRPLAPRWGFSSCLTFVGRIQEKLGEREAAGDYFRRALERHPRDRLAREGLSRVETGSDRL